MQKKGKKGKKGGGQVTGKGKSDNKDRKGKKSRGHVVEYVSDDKKIYGDFDEEPDPNLRDFYYDDVDEFHEGKDQILLEQGYQMNEGPGLSDEEEVLALDSEESDDEEIRDLKAKLREVQKYQHKSRYGSDLDEESSEEEEEDEEAGLPDSKAWGKKRSRYYGDDDVEVTDLHDEEAEAVLEEKEALKIQKKLAEQLDEQDFGLDVFAPPEKSKDVKSTEEKIVKDLSKLSKREKLKILKKKSPELLTLIEEFKERMQEVLSSLCPMKKLLEQNQCTGKAVEYINTKFRLNLNYCTNIVFYLMLKAKQIPVHNHPVIKRLLQHRNMLKQLEPIDEQFKDEMTEILTKLKEGEKVELKPQQEKTFVRRQRMGDKKSDKRKIPKASTSHSDSENSDDLYEDMNRPSKKKMKDDRFLTNYEKEALEFYDMMKESQEPKSVLEADETLDDEEMNEEDTEGTEEQVEGEEGDSKRAITYQIEKNRGLTARKKKELRNPRVKHKMKYKKAKIRRKAQVQEVRREIQKYGGELSGIRATIAKGVKLKN